MADLPLCSGCGWQPPEDANFCMKCGRPLPTASSALRQARKVITVLFSDLVGSTSLAESMDPEVLRVVLRRYFLAMKGAIERYDGIVERLLGDGLMGIFGVPVVREDDALRAVSAAVQMGRALKTLNRDLSKILGIALHMRIGINSGEVLVGQDELTGHLTGGIVGDAVNVAARLETAASPGEVLLGELTKKLCRTEVVAEPVELILKGKAAPVAAFRLLHLADVSQRRKRSEVRSIGRQAELDIVTAAFQEATEISSPVAVTVTGDAGIGKSRLITEFVSSVDTRATVLQGRCLAYGDLTSLWPFAEMVCQAAGTSTEVDADALTAAISALGVATGISDSIDRARRLVAYLGLGPSEGLAEEGPYDLAETLKAATAGQPLVCVLDDLHWVKRPLLDLIPNLNQGLAGVPVLLIGCGRPELLETSPAWHRGAARHYPIELTALSRAQSLELLEGLIKGGSALTALTEKVLDIADGNPLVIEEFVAMLIDDGLLRRAVDGTWQILESSDLHAMPATISAILAARLDRLPDSHRDVLECAAVVGQECFRTELAALSRVRDADLEEAINSLLEKRLMGLSERPSAASLRFHHILIRDAAYEATTKRRRAEIHENYGSYLETNQARERGAVLADIVGVHLETAWHLRRELGESIPELRPLGRRAASSLAVAAHNARRNADFVSAMSTCRRALEIHSDIDSLQADLLFGLGVAAMDLGDPTEAFSVLQRAANVSPGHERGEPHGLAQIGVLVASRFAGVESFDEVLPQARQVLTQLESSTDHFALEQAWSLYSQLLGSVGHYDEGLLGSSRALEHALAAKRRQLHYHYIGICSCALMGSTPVNEVLKRCEEAARHFQPGSVHAALLDNVWAVATAMTGDFGCARQKLAEARTTCEVHLSGHWGAASLWYLGICELIASDFHASEGAFRQAQAEFARFGNDLMARTCSAYQAVALARQGRRDEARKAASFASAGTDRSDDETQVLWRIGESLALRDLSDWEEAVTVAHEATQIASCLDNLWIRAESFMCLAEILAAVGRRQDARAALRQAITLYQRKGVSPRVDGAMARLDTLNSH
jgi:class 3 adenylate cyclase/tetratricopeptide (TPR) repeat protein